jgi:hypothetical protein
VLRHVDISMERSAPIFSVVIHNFSPILGLFDQSTGRNIWKGFYTLLHYCHKFKGRSRV